MTGTKKPADANSLWGGRFSGGPADIMRRINASIDFDKRLYAEDIAGSKAHCAMLVAQNILSPQDGATIATGLDQIKLEIEGGSGRPRGVCTPRARATIRSRPICACGCAPQSIGSMPQCANCRAH